MYVLQVHCSLTLIVGMLLVEVHISYPCLFPNMVISAREFEHLVMLSGLCCWDGTFTNSIMVEQKKLINIAAFSKKKKPYCSILMSNPASVVPLASKVKGVQQSLDLWSTSNSSLTFHTISFSHC